MDEQLLSTSRDYLHFVTSFFEPINVSATHIYHSALELSPEYSTVRKLYYDRRPTPFPRLVTGIADSWDSSIDIPRPGHSSGPPIWSPCGRFVATGTQEAVKIWDSLTAALLSTLQPDRPTRELMGAFAYSPDGCSLACASDTGIIIWDIQTGGVAKEIQSSPTIDLLVWSLDGGTICTRTRYLEGDSAVGIFDVVLGTAQSFIILDPQDVEHVWAHDKSFRVMTYDKTRLNWIIDIFEVGLTLTKIESFDIRLTEIFLPIGWVTDWEITSFSPTSYRISVLYHSPDQLLVLDIRNSGRLLVETQMFNSHCFSPDGGFFAVSQISTVQIWKYDGSSYVAWRKIPTPGSFPNLLFSPTSSSALGASRRVLKVWQLDDLSLHPTPYSGHFCTFPRSGAYLVIARNPGNAITITDALSRTPLQLVYTGVDIRRLGLTGNILVVMGSEVIVAWLLTEEGLVNGVLGDRIAVRGDSIWTVPKPLMSSLSVDGETAVIKTYCVVLHTYNTRTGEALAPDRTALDRGKMYHLSTVMDTQSHLYYDSIGDTPPPRDDWNPLQNKKKGWVKDRGGRHLLWLPVEWRDREMKWFFDVAIIQFESPYPRLITIKLY